MPKYGTLGSFIFYKRMYRYRTTSPYAYDVCKQIKDYHFDCFSGSVRYGTAGTASEEGLPYRKRSKGISGSGFIEVFQVPRVLGA